MNLLKPSYTIEDQKEFDLVGIEKFIEKCARVCYKSESKITDDSHVKFVNNLIKRGHMRPLEFGTVYLYLPSGFADGYGDLIDFYKYNQWSRCIGVFQDQSTDGYYITTNYRVIIENNKQSHLKFLCKPTEYHAKRHTVHFVLSRGCMDDFRTHVSLSHLGESTRYCNYTNDKFGGITYIIPQWCQNVVPAEELNAPEVIKKYIRNKSCSQEENILLKTLYANEVAYFALISFGKIPQEAREDLPLCVKSELISCGYEDAWDNFFFRRTHTDAQKEAQVLAGALSKEFEENGWYTLKNKN